MSNNKNLAFDWNQNSFDGEITLTALAIDIRQMH